MYRYFVWEIRRRPKKDFDDFESDITISNVFVRQGNLAISHQVEYSNEATRGRKETMSCVHAIFRVNKNREIFTLFMKKIRYKFRYHHEWELFKTDARRAIFTPEVKEWCDVLPDKIALWASRRLQEISRGESCVDNYRVARVGNTCQERRYRRSVKRGCCGFQDIIDVCPHDGLSYRLGFNYGH